MQKSPLFRLISVLFVLILVTPPLWNCSDPASAKAQSEASVSQPEVKIEGVNEIGWSISSLYTAGNWNPTVMSDGEAIRVAGQAGEYGAVLWVNIPQQVPESAIIPGFKVSDQGQAVPNSEPANTSVYLGNNWADGIDATAFNPRADLILTAWIEKQPQELGTFHAVRVAVVGAEAMRLTGSVVNEKVLAYDTPTFGPRVAASSNAWSVVWTEYGKLWSIRGTSPTSLTKTPINLWGGDDGTIQAVDLQSPDKVTMAWTSNQPLSSIVSCHINWAAGILEQCSGKTNRDLGIPDNFYVKDLQVLNVSGWVEPLVFLEVNENYAVGGVWAGTLTTGFKRLGFGQNVSFAADHDQAVAVWEKEEGGLEYAQILLGAVLGETGMVTTYPGDKWPVAISASTESFCFADLYGGMSWWLNCKMFGPNPPTPTPSPTPTEEPTSTPTMTPTATETTAPVLTATRTPTSTKTQKPPTVTKTSSPTRTASPTRTPTITRTPTRTKTPTMTPTPTNTPRDWTPEPTVTPTFQQFLPLVMQLGK